MKLLEGYVRLCAAFFPQVGLSHCETAIKLRICDIVWWDMVSDTQTAKFCFPFTLKLGFGYIVFCRNWNS